MSSLLVILLTVGVCIVFHKSAGDHLGTAARIVWRDVTVHAHFFIFSAQ